MIEEILKIYSDNLATQTKISKPSFECKYCNKSFAKESTLFVHNCESKRRAKQEKEQGVQIGFNAYLRFYQLTQPNTKPKLYADFCKSPYYIAFVKFGRYLVEIRAIAINAFIDSLIKSNTKLDYWCSEANYFEFIQQHLLKEPMEDALSRSLNEMQDYAEENKLAGGLKDYFRHGNTSKICLAILHGRISPWMIYCSSSGMEFLDRITGHQLEIILPYIDPDVWDKRLKKYFEDRDLLKATLLAAEL